MRLFAILRVCVAGFAVTTAGCGAGLFQEPPADDAGVSETADARAAFGPVTLREAIEGAAHRPQRRDVPASEPDDEPPSLLDALHADAIDAGAADVRDETPLQPRHAAPVAAPALAARADAGGLDAGGGLTPRGVLFAVHLASYRTADAARRGWDILAAQPALSDLEPRVERVELADKGVFLRLKAGPLPTRAVAQERCAALMAEGLYCAVEVHAGEALE